MQQALIVGERVPTERVLEALATAGRRARAWSPEPAQADEAAGSSAGIARGLIGLEREMERDRPAEVVVADDSDTALAATIVAAKLLIPVEAELEGESVNARLISQLAATYTPQG